MFNICLPCVICYLGLKVLRGLGIVNTVPVERTELVHVLHTRSSRPWVFREVVHCKSDIALDTRRVKVGKYHSAKSKLHAGKTLFTIQSILFSRLWKSWAAQKRIFERQDVRREWVEASDLTVRASYGKVWMGSAASLEDALFVHASLEDAFLEDLSYLFLYASLVDTFVPCIYICCASRTASFIIWNHTLHFWCGQVTMVVMICPLQLSEISTLFTRVHK